MREFIIRVVVNAIAIAITAAILPGITVVNNDIGTLIIVGLVFGIINALVKPIVVTLTCPFVLLSMGLFLLVINGCMLMLTASFSDGRLIIDGFIWAIVGGIVMGIIGMILEGIFNVRQDPKRDVPQIKRPPRGGF